MVTYAVAAYGDSTAVIKITTDPAYSIIAVCTSFEAAQAIVAALNGA